MTLLNSYSDIQTFNLWNWEHKPPCRKDGCDKQAEVEVIDPRLIFQNTRVAYYCLNHKEELFKEKQHGDHDTVSTK